MGNINLFWEETKKAYKTTRNYISTKALLIFYFTQYILPFYNPGISIACQCTSML